MSFTFRSHKTTPQFVGTKLPGISILLHEMCRNSQPLRKILSRFTFVVNFRSYMRDDFMQMPTLNGPEPALHRAAHESPDQTETWNFYEASKFTAVKRESFVVKISKERELRQQITITYQGRRVIKFGNRFHPDRNEKLISERWPGRAFDGKLN